MAKEENEFRDEMEKRLANAEVECETWKQDKSDLYDLLITFMLEWPSLTVEWLPDWEEPTGEDYAVQKLILGTHKSDDEPNYLMLAKVHLPLLDVVKDAGTHNERCEVGDFGPTNVKGQVIQQIHHEGEVNRARCMPQNPNLIATRTVSAEAYVFDCSKHPLEPPKGGQCKPDVVLRGHKAEGHGLSWSTLKEGHLLSGSDDALICLWDIGANTPNNASGRTIDAKQIFRGHVGVVKDVAWHSTHECLFGSVGDDRQLLIWDSRSSSTEKPLHAIDAHQAEVNCLAFCKLSEWVLTTGSADNTIALYDLRKLSTSLYTFANHTEEVVQIGWSPLNQYLLASCGADKRLMVWDLSRIGDEQLPQDADNGPPELLFTHDGHNSKISDFSWNVHEELLIGSVSDDSFLQLWKMSEKICYNEDND